MPSPSPSSPGSPVPAAGDEARAVLQRTAALARLEISAEEVLRLGPQFENILASFQVLAEIDVTGMEPMTGPGHLRDITRADEPRAGLTQAQALANAPEVQDGCYGVPKTVGGAG